MRRTTQTSAVFRFLKLVPTQIGKPLFKFLLFLIVQLIVLVAIVRKLFKLLRFNRTKYWPSFQIKFALLALPIGLFMLGVTMLYRDVKLFFIELPDVSTLPNYKSDASTKLYDRNGKLLYKFYNEVNRTPLSLSQIPLSLRQATVAAEDHDFYSHKGISFKAIARAVLTWIKGGNLTGASTITQQLVKNVYLTPIRTLDRKIREMVLATRTETLFTKDQILELYLNRVPYGGTAYGVEEASQHYFGKPVQKINLAEAAFLASLPQSPSEVKDPNSPTLQARINSILEQMKELGFINQAEEIDAQNTKIAFKREPLLSEAPHFVMFMKQLLSSSFSPQAIYTGGFNVYTTLDPDIQEIAEEAVSTELSKLTRFHVTNAGVLVFSVKTGDILAMVGSRDYNDFEHGGNVNTTTSIRPPGSSIKLVNYTYALSHGYTPATIVDDSPITFKIAGSPPYTPKDYDGTFKGKMPLREALAQSRNIPAVRVLNSYGVKNMVEMGQKMGITSWSDASKFGLSLTLGGGGVTLLDLSSAYLTIANLGQRISIQPVSQIYDKAGKRIGPLCVGGNCIQEQVVDPRVAFQLIDILSDNKARTPAFGPNSTLVIPGHPEVSVKTGTSNDLRDNLTVGFNQEYLVAVWVGNNDNSPMSRVASGITGASPIWNTIMKELLKDKPSIAWSPPSGMSQVSLCGGKKEWFIDGTAPTNQCGEAPVAEKTPRPQRLTGLTTVHDF